MNQRTRLKSYLDMNREHGKKSKNDFKKDFFNLMNNVLSRKTMENIRNYRDIKVIKNELFSLETKL